MHKYFQYPVKEDFHKQVFDFNKKKKNNYYYIFVNLKKNKIEASPGPGSYNDNKYYSHKNISLGKFN
jgi:hypothetical protein